MTGEKVEIGNLAGNMNIKEKKENENFSRNKESSVRYKEQKKLLKLILKMLKLKE